MPSLNLAEPSEQQAHGSLFLGILIWFLHLSLLNGLISVACKWGWLTYPVGSLSGLQLVELVVSVIAGLLLVFMVYLAWRYWSSFQAQSPTDNPRLFQETEKDRRPLLAFVAMLLNALLTLFVLGTFVIIFALKACGHA